MLESGVRHQLGGMHTARQALAMVLMYAATVALKRILQSGGVADGSKVSGGGGGGGVELRR